MVLVVGLWVVLPGVNDVTKQDQSSSLLVLQRLQPVGEIWQNSALVMNITCHIGDGAWGDALSQLDR